jgi:hypothetical protein
MLRRELIGWSPQEGRGISTEFANHHCAVEAEQFLPRPQWQSRFYETRTQPHATIKQTTNKHKTKLQRLFELM